MEQEIIGQQKKMINVLIAILVMMIIIGIGLFLHMGPKVERAVLVAERMEARLQSFADKVEPVLDSSASKAVETVQKMDSERLSETATNKTDEVLNAAAEWAKRKMGSKEDAEDAEDAEDGEVEKVEKVEKDKKE